MKKLICASAVLLAAGSAAYGEELHERNISLATAAQIAQAGVEICGAKGFGVSTAVVDRAGVLRSLMRADNAGPHTVDSAKAKAFTSASIHVPTSALAKAVQENPSAAGLVDIPGFLILGGGVPIKIGNEIIGAVGVGGTPSADTDEACAAAAIEKVKDRLK